MAVALNFDEFDRGLRRFTEKLVPEAALREHRKIALLALQGVTLRTPVDTGFARGNWQLTIGEYPSGVIDPPGVVKRRKPGEDRSSQRNPPAADIARRVLAEGQATIGKLKPYQTSHLTNNAPYIEQLEGGQHSAQAPNGMVRVTLQEILVTIR